MKYPRLKVSKRDDGTWRVLFHNVPEKHQFTVFQANTHKVALSYALRYVAKEQPIYRAFEVV